MNYLEQALTFDCAGSRLSGIITRPVTAADTGVLILVGGPQYRAGSHRQFTLLARQLANQGIASMRFDYRGMGDSEGEPRTFEEVDDDIRAALDTLLERTPGLRHIALWGLCDAASSAMLYAHTDARINSLILLNPWVHSEAGAARTRLKHYYLARLTQRSFWKKLLSGKLSLGQSANDLTKSAQSALTTAAPATPTDPRHGLPGYIERMRSGLNRYRGGVLVILSGNDLVAQEFISLTRNNKDWKRIMRSPRFTQCFMPEANHTFSTQVWRDAVADHTSCWLAARHPDKNIRK
ncbi:MAG: hydrolase 1, exosortase A system-associated [Gallionella sp.]|nr:hydrolase 1, exosortase A system-associated [Gallionella sp.]MDD4945573.1 hydrolase 1, exosortase A system-associated [Gallionella sp.]